MRLLLFCFILNAFLYLALANNNLVNKKVDRRIDLTSQLVRITTRIVAENLDDKPIDEYYFVLDPQLGEHLAYINAYINFSSQKNNLKIETKNQHNFVIKLGTIHSIKSKLSSELIVVETVFTKLLEPFPKEIKQGEHQFVKYNGNYYYFSLYSTKSQTTTVVLPSTGSIESYSKTNLTSLSDRVLTHGPFKNIEKLTESHLQVHFENNSPTLIVKNLERKIEISPWSKAVRVQDTIEVYHNGAKLIGSFSRYDYQKDPHSGISAVTLIKTKINKASYNIYYRDEIGNISTSDIRVYRDDLVVHLKPRFPLFGGWKTFYILGYSLPIDEVIDRTKNNRHQLRINFVDHIYDNQVINEAKVEIILPEGANNFKVYLPFEAERLADSNHYSYLSLISRNVITFKKNNLINEHVQYIEVTYDYNDLWKLQEPLLVLALILIFITGLFIWSKLDFSLVKKQKQL